MKKIEIIFTNIMPRILEIIKETQRELKICVGWMSFDYFHSTFLMLLKKNIKINIIIDDNYLNRRYDYLIEDLIFKGANVHFIKLKSKFNKMHEKFIIVDNRLCCIGSSNFTKNSMKNIENMMIIKEKNIIFALDYEYNALKNSISVLKKLSSNKTECNVLFPEFGTRGSEDNERAVLQFYRYKINIKKNKITKLEFVGDAPIELLEGPSLYDSYYRKEYQKEIKIEKFSNKYLEQLNYDVNSFFDLLFSSDLFNLDAILIKGSEFTGRGKEIGECLKVIWRNRFSSTIDQVLEMYDIDDFEWL